MERPGHFCTIGLKVGTLLHICGTESGHFCTSTERSRDTSAHLRVAEMKGMGQFYTTGEHKIRKREKEIRC